MMAETSRNPLGVSGLERLASSLEKASDDDVQALHEAIELFNQHTQELREAYDALRERVSAVDRELEVKNRHLEEQVREIERLKGDLDEIIESMDNGLIAADTEGIVFTFNKAAEKALGLPRSDVLGTSLEALLESGGRTISQSLKEGRSCPLEVTVTVAGNHAAYLRGTITPLNDREGCRRGATYIFTDLTKQRLLEERARRADRMTALGELAAGVAHEMRNPLTTIRGYLQMLPNFKDDDNFIEEFSDNLIREIDRLTRLTNDMLDMAKPVAKDRRHCDLGSLVNEVVSFLANRVKESGAEIAVHTDPLGSPVVLDRDRVKQVFINLIVNALEACGEGAEIVVRLHRTEEQVDEAGSYRHFVMATVKDNGPGMEPEQLERVFDPFFTTKLTGTGLGLALSSRIAEEHDGLLRAESEEGKGTAFSLLLPLAEET